MELVLQKPSRNIFYRVINKIKRGIIDIGRRKIRRRILMLSPSPKRQTTQSFSVHMLLCHKDLEMGICAAKSFVLASRQPYEFTFHDDGSLTNTDKSLLTFHFPGCIIIDYTTSLDKAKNTFGENSEIFKMRIKGVMMLKLIDVHLFSNKKKVILLDSDILFFEYPKAILEAVESNTSPNYFNKDIESAYMADQSLLENICGFKLPERINAGLSIIYKDSIRFDLIEVWLLKIKEQNIPFIMHRIEQTLISMLCANSLYKIDHLPEGYDVAYFKDVSKSICKHYVGRIRHNFEFEGLVYVLNEKNFEEEWKSFVK